MESYKEFAALKSGASGESKPSIKEYILFQLSNNFFIGLLLILCIVFASIGFWGSSDSTKVNWALHASELCLGVLLGRMKLTK